jgi:signal transduction histidine kinase/ActR/RegA family two-component response regulator
MGLSIKIKCDYFGMILASSPSRRYKRMMHPEHGRKAFVTLSLVLCLAACGFAADSFPLSLFLGFNAYFGGVFGFFAFLLLGPLPGFAVMVLSAAAAAFRGDLVYFAVAALEAVAVCFFNQGRSRNVLLVDASFWFAIGLGAAALGEALGGAKLVEAALAGSVFAICGIVSASAGCLSFDISRIAFPRLKRLGEMIPLRRAVFETCIILAFVPILALLVVTSQSRTKGLSVELSNRLGTLAASYDLVVDVWLDEKESELASIAAAAAEVGPGDGSAIAALERRLNALRLSEDDIAAVGILDSNGRIAAASANRKRLALDAPGLDFSGATAYRNALATGASSFQAEPALDGIPSLVIVRPIAPASSASAAYCVIELTPLAGLLNGLAQPLGSQALILDPSGRIIVSTEKGAPFLSPFAPREGYAEIPRSGAVHGKVALVVDPAKKGYYWVDQAKLSPGWRIVFSLPLEPFRTPVVATGLALCIFVLIAILITLIASSVSSSFLGNSFERLRSVAEGFIEKPEFDAGASWPNSYIAEVASISDAFSKAAELLAERYRETLAALAEAEKADREKERLLAAVSHDIRGPLSGMVDIAGVLERDLEGGERRDQARIIKETGTDLKELVEGLLDRSSIEAGRLELHAAPFDLRLLFDAALRDYRPAAEAKALELAFSWDDRLPRHVIGDRARLFQVLGNLLGNAVKYTEAGRVSMSASLLAPDSPDEREEREEAAAGAEALVRFVVEDTGIGLGDELKKRIFEPYFRGGGSSDQARIKGLGLGLAIAQGIVELMGGRIEVESEPGKGSAFSFAIPLARAKGRLGAPAAAEHRAEPVPRARILLADDMRINRMVAKRALESAGHSVVEAEDGRAAVDAALASDFDLVLLDLSMPRLDGRAAMRELRSRMRSESPKGRRPLIVALTASTSEEEAKMLLDYGFDGYLAKPASGEQLLETVREAMLGPRAEAKGAPEPRAAASESLLDYDGLIAAYGGSREFLRTILEVFVKDGADYVAAIRASCARAQEGAEIDGADLMKALHSLVNVMGAGSAASALAAARAAERSLLASNSYTTPALEEAGLERALAEAARAIDQVRVYLEKE